MGKKLKWKRWCKDEIFKFCFGGLIDPWLTYWWSEDICIGCEVSSIFGSYSLDLWVGNETQNTLEKNQKFFMSSSLYK
jgi:hypothetical protein